MSIQLQVGCQRACPPLQLLHQALQHVLLGVPPQLRKALRGPSHRLGGLFLRPCTPRNPLPGVGWLRFRRGFPRKLGSVRLSQSVLRWGVLLSSAPRQLLCGVRCAPGSASLAFTAVRQFLRLSLPVGPVPGQKTSFSVQGECQWQVCTSRGYFPVSYGSPICMKMLLEY